MSQLACKARLVVDIFKSECVHSSAIELNQKPVVIGCGGFAPTPVLQGLKCSRTPAATQIPPSVATPKSPSS